MTTIRNVLFMWLTILFSILTNDASYVQGSPNPEQVSPNFPITKGTQNPPDSSQFDYENFEHNLVIFRNVDSLEMSVQDMVHFSIFRIDGQKFAVLIDSTTKVYKFTRTRFQKIYHIRTGIGPTSVSKRKMDVNLDGFMDIVFEIPGGGTYGSDFVFLFYHPFRKTLVYDAKSNMRNCIMDVKKGWVKSQYNYSSILYSIKKYSFRKRVSYEYLIYRSEDSILKNKTIRSVFDRKGRIVQVDTIPDK